VVLDGCTDQTYSIVKRLSKKYRVIKVIRDGKRIGKATRLNQIYRINRSELLATFDADLIFERDCEVELMVKELLGHRDAQLVSGAQQPVELHSFFGRASNASFNILQEASRKWRRGNNVHAVQGAVCVMKKEFAKTIHLPSDTTCDQGHLYLMAIKKGRRSFRFAKNTHIFFRTASTFMDWRKLGTRTTVYDRVSIAKVFGEKGLSEYKMPKKYYYLAVLSLFISDPIGVIGAVVLNIFVRLKPYNVEKVQSGAWEMIESSKNLFNI